MAESLTGVFVKESESVTFASRPERMPFHWLYFGFFGLAMTSSLWQHGHPVLTLCLLALLVPAACVVYIPYRILGYELRSWLQTFLIGAAIFWAIFRLSGQVAIDKILIETICIMGLSFAFTTRRSDYGYLFLISIMLLVYGALLPRVIYLVLLFCSFLLGLLLLYGSRVVAIAGDYRVGLPSGAFRRNWKHFILHAALTVAVWVYIFSIFPSRHMSGKGLIAVSFRTENDSYIPPQLDKWLKSRRHKSSIAGRTLVYGRENPLISRRKGPEVNGGEESEKSVSSRNSGSGGGIPGRDLVFRVKSPLKLYWLAALYDNYDGEKWTADKAFKNQVLRYDQLRKESGVSKRIEQEFIIEKWISPSFYAVYRPNSFTASTLNYSDRTKTFYGARIKDGVPYPETPFTYNVISTVALFDEDKLEKLKNASPENNEKSDKAKRREFMRKGNGLWSERISPAHYMRLPLRKISGRVKKLAQVLTRNCANDYQKAMALRDFLRKTYKYELITGKIPEGKEAVDYFLFELKKGHCEYFASALAVLARLNGLPARVATGFSPGNYNALNGYFEVYEYHAHAWTQIFIKELGWLTFDATPPGEIISRTTPVGIGSFHDPFGDEWRVTPPEVTGKAADLLSIKKNRHPEGGKKPFTEPEEDLGTEIFMKVVMAPENIANSIDKVTERVFPPKGGRKFRLKDLFKTARINFMLLLKQCALGFMDFVNWLTKGDGIILLVFICILVPLLYLVPFIKNFLTRRYRMRRCLKWLKRAGENIQADPAETVRLCYRTVRELLDMAGWPRRDNMELFEYGRSLRQLDKNVCRDTLVVYYFYSQLEYGRRVPEKEDSGTVFERTGKIREALRELARSGRLGAR